MTKSGEEVRGGVIVDGPLSQQSDDPIKEQGTDKARVSSDRSFAFVIENGTGKDGAAVGRKRERTHDFGVWFSKV